MVLYIVSLYFTIKRQLQEAGTMQSHVITLSHNTIVNLSQQPPPPPIYKIYTLQSSITIHIGKGVRASDKQVFFNLISKCLFIPLNPS